MDDEPQLDLFTWDRIKVGEGFRALARLDLAKAVGMFEDVLSKWHGHPDAAGGLRMAGAWGESLRRAETLQKEDAVAFLWERIECYPFGHSGQALRRELILRAIALMEGDCYLHIPPDLCLGRLLLEVEDYSQGEEALRRLLERRPADGRLLICLGNCLLRQGRKTEARVVYARAFLSSPWEVELGEIDDKDLVGAIADEDIYSAAVCGWLRHVLPFVDVAVGSPHDGKHKEALLVYQTVRRAERARGKAAHEEMVQQRRLLKEIAPTVFFEYMGRMQRAPKSQPPILHWSPNAR
jgi:tetratricopeptide (TPR) repeat protein